MVNETLIAFMLGPMEIGAILLVGLLLFGNRLPNIGKSLGRSLVEFKKGVRGIEDDINIDVNTNMNQPSDNQYEGSSKGGDENVSETSGDS